MKSKDEYLREISRRGDHYGGHGGVLDLLDWCQKSNVQQVTPEEARRFLAEWAPAQAGQEKDRANG